MVGEEFDKVKPGVAIRSAHVGMAASNTYVFLTEVLPRAIKKYGGVDPEALRKAALETDIPEGGTMLASASVLRRGTPMAGRTSARSRWSSSTSTTSRMWCGRRARRSARRVLPPKGTTFSNQ
jgi:branched-chain amino acid transport system substrate-binding protein